jgi:hypothetical protein
MWVVQQAEEIAFDLAAGSSTAKGPETGDPKRGRS